MVKEEKVPVLLKEGASLPSYATQDAAGADVRAYIEDVIILKPGDRQLIPTGISFEIPKGYEIQVRPRSGLALQYGISVLNSPGTIDADYRGELGVILINHGKEPFIIKPNMRIAQIVLAPVSRAIFQDSTELTSTMRGERGFGHTGTH